MPERKITGYTYTGLRNRPRRLYTVGDVSLPGVSIPGLVVGVCAFLATVSVGAVVQGITGGPMTLVGVLLGLVTGGAAYTLWGRTVGDLGGAIPTMTMAFDYRFRQPRTIRVAGADTQPTSFHWQVILWEPTDPGWVARRDHTRSWLIDHAPDGRLPEVNP